MKAVILMAGIGSRLGRALPKCLTELPGGETIIGRQIRLLRPHVDGVFGVVGFKKELILEMYPDIGYIYNPAFTQTNTSKSLLAALKVLGEDDFLWLNGDVVFESGIVERVLSFPGNAVAVKYESCGAEEVKFSLDPAGHIRGISKEVSDALGEAVGINKITRQDYPEFRRALEECADMDYFEKAIETCITRGITFAPVRIEGGTCVEVDFPSDLQDAWTALEQFSPLPGSRGEINGRMNSFQGDSDL